MADTQIKPIAQPEKISFGQDSTNANILQRNSFIAQRMSKFVELTRELTPKSTTL